MRADRTLEEILIEIGKMDDSHIMACTKGEYKLLLTRKEFTLSEEEARVIVQELMHSFVSPDNQKIVSQLILRLEKELED